MNNFCKLSLTGLLLCCATPYLAAQAPVTAGKGSYAPYPPSYKAKTDEHSGFNATKMLTRKIYADETDKEGNQRPIPTNDWWTDLLASQFSGALWSYPAMCRTSEAGLEIHYPSYWYDNGTEVKSRSSLTVGAQNFTAAEARAHDWHDWDVEILFPSTAGNESMSATLSHGSPFTWIEFDGLTPSIAFSATPELSGKGGKMTARIGDDLYGLYFDKGATTEMKDGFLLIHGASWLSVALLTTEEDLDLYEPFAASVVRSTEVTWKYDTQKSLLNTEWQVTAENLREKGAQAPVMQGFLPHAYKYAVAESLPFIGKEYLSPRGTLKMATADNGHFNYAYRFSGMLPYYKSPQTGNSATNGYDPAVMRSLIEKYARGGSFGDDTYWGGKGLIQMALNMTFAKETGNMDLYETSKSKLRDALADWLTYTPGENTKFYSYYPRWGGMLGFDVSYDSDAFNDHHFHYGYLLYASALLALEDKSFRDGYGEILTMIAKDYANYDHEDSRFPFLRTLDPWAGHSYAGGMGDHVNDNGNGQESSSEAMQGWGGMYLLGVALGDDEMRDAGIFGWLTESRGTAEYWFDRDHIHPGRQHNYDYTKYEHPYNTNLTSKGIGWWTWFSGDALWMHSIQWMPVSPCLNYLSEDLEFAKWDYEQMRDATGYKWFEKTDEGDPLADQSVGNVVLCYMERSNPEEAASIFNQALEGGFGIATGVDTGHISYFVIHNHLTYGDIDFTVHTDCPTANLYVRPDGTETYMVYNPGDSERTVNFYRDGELIRKVKAAPRMTAFRDESVPESIELTSAEGLITPPGSDLLISGRVLDQYGASIDDAAIIWSADNNAHIEAGKLTVPASAARGSHINVKAVSGELSASLRIEVNDKPVGQTLAITDTPAFIEVGSTCSPGLEMTDQYGTVTSPDAVWTATDSQGNTVETDPAGLTFTAPGRYTLKAEAAGLSDEVTLMVYPALPNVALHKPVKVSSEENAGTLAANATDGDEGSRWGSQHSDDQWIYVDLGADYFITSSTIIWEAAYGSDYDILVAPDGSDPTKADSWQTVYEQRGLNRQGAASHPFAAKGRYVKMQGITRGSAYGYSMYELQVSGVRSDASADEIIGLGISAPTIALENDKVPVSATGVTFGGDVVSLSDIVWSSTPEGKWSDGYFTPTTYGVHTLTATRGDMSASTTLLVEESAKLKSLTVSPEKSMILTGGSVDMEVEGLNQFGGLYPLDATDYSVTITDGDGGAVDGDAAWFDKNTMRLTAHRRGDYTLDFSGMATAYVEVRDVTEANLASGKHAVASSSRDGNVADNATDMNMQTRWESEWDDNQWIYVDLENQFRVNKVVISWEGAYADHYSVDVSTDGDTWIVAKEVKNGKGGEETIDFDPVAAKYVRIYAYKRHTGYGNSIYELGVYGTEQLTTSTVEIDTDNDEVEVFSAEGYLIGRFASGVQLNRQLQPGVYLVRRNGKVTKTMVGSN